MRLQPHIGLLRWDSALLVLKRTLLGSKQRAGISCIYQPRDLRCPRSRLRGAYL